MRRRTPSAAFRGVFSPAMGVNTPQNDMARAWRAFRGGFGPGEGVNTPQNAIGLPAVAT